MFAMKDALNFHEPDKWFDDDFAYRQKKNKWNSFQICTKSEILNEYTYHFFL